MKKNLFLSALVLICTFIITSCDKDNIDDTDITAIYDCPDLELDFGDVCTYTVIVNLDTVVMTGIVTTDCDCETTTMFDCPDLGLNIGDDCSLHNEFGYVSDNCECRYCPDLGLMIGDTCTLSGGGAGIVGLDCECDAISAVDCPSLGLDIGDLCPSTNGNGHFGTVSSDCECVFDCPINQWMIGNDCIVYDNDGNVLYVGMVNDNCDCETTTMFDCPDLGLNIGDDCIYTFVNSDSTSFWTVVSTVNADCECQEIMFDCTELPLNIGDSCANINEFGYVSDNCECRYCPDLDLNIDDPCTLQGGGTGTVQLDCQCE